MVEPELKAQAAEIERLRGELSIAQDAQQKTYEESIRYRGALEKISRPTMIPDLLWWQIEAREALKGEVR